MRNGKGLIVTGGNGALGTELRQHLPHAKFLGREELDITVPSDIAAAIETHNPDGILHLAAYTAVPKAETERVPAFLVNAGGTHNLTEACRQHDLKMIYVSSDYVFDGEEGMYKTSALRNPINWYGFTKAEGERVVENYSHHLILRTSFKPKEFPYPRAFEDLWTSADFIDVIAPLLVEQLERTGKVHIGTERKSIYDLVKRRKPEVEPMFRTEIRAVKLPRDVSMVIG